MQSGFVFGVGLAEGVDGIGNSIEVALEEFHVSLRFSLARLGDGDFQVIESTEDRVEHGFLIFRRYCVLSFIVVPVFIGDDEGRGCGSLGDEWCGRGMLPILMPFLGPVSLSWLSCSSDISTIAALNFAPNVATRVISSKGIAPMIGVIASLI